MHPNAQLIFGASVRPRGEINLEIEPQGEIVVTAVITRYEDGRSPPPAIIAPLDLFTFRPATRGELVRK